jgi:hypothetical protein
VPFQNSASTVVFSAAFEVVPFQNSASTVVFSAASEAVPFQKQRLNGSFFRSL